MEFIHKKCGRKVQVSTFRGGRCNKCHKRFWPLLCLFSLDLMPSETRGEKQERRTREVVKEKVEAAKKKKGERKQYADWAEKVEPAKWTAGRLPNWPRWARVLSAALVLSAIGALMWFLLWR
jgi:hypothetical protein